MILWETNFQKTDPAIDNPYCILIIKIITLRKPELMDSSSILTIIENITSILSTDELIMEFKNVFSLFFPSKGISVLELSRCTRNPENGEYDYTVVDLLNPDDPPFRISEETFLSSVLMKKESCACRQNGKEEETLLLYPVIKGRDISHIIRIIVSENITKPDSDLERLIGIFSNVLSLIEEKDRDYLTDLHNRMYFNKVMKTSGSNFFSHLAMLDIDHFKLVNDTCGHLIGDEVLIHFANIIRSSFRREDFKIRYGGEEFLILFKNTENKNVSELLNRFREVIRNYNFPGVGKLTVSIGYCTIGKSGDLYQSSARADRALYFAKENGRNQVFSYEELLSLNKLTPAENKPGEITLWN